jgi:CDGSH-type Zn-finger protein
MRVDSNESADNTHSPERPLDAANARSPEQPLNARSAARSPERPLNAANARSPEQPLNARSAARTPEQPLDAPSAARSPERPTDAAPTSPQPLHASNTARMPERPADSPSPAPAHNPAPKMEVPPGHPFIEIRENGPLLVHNVSALRLADGTRAEVETTFALCRCGGSAKKPFCDGTHKRNGFSGAREITAPLDRSRAYQGAGITIHDNRTICSHAEHCIHDVPQVFRKGAMPWIDAGGSGAEAILDLVRRCPSGALTASLDGQPISESNGEFEIAVDRGGPYRVTGRVELSGELQPPVPERFTLCRCGHSRNKPFCDGTHFDVEFDR